MKMQLQRGFTVIELMISIALMGVLATVAVPAFNSIMKQNRLAAQANSILSSINYARSETINQNNNVVVQPNTAGTNWSGGWQVNINGTVVRQFEGIENGTLTSSAATFTYVPGGSIAGTAIVTLTLTPSDCPTGNNDLRVLTISLSGQISTAQGVCP